MPYPGHCDAIGPDYAKLVGLNLLQDFRKHVQARLGGCAAVRTSPNSRRCCPTAAVQAFADEVFKTRDTAHDAHHEDDTKPWQLDRCHALRSDGPAVEPGSTRAGTRPRGSAAANDQPPPTPIKDGMTR